MSQQHQNIYDICLNGDITRLESLIQSHPKLLTLPDKENGMTPIHWAANGGKIDCIELLIAAGLDVNVMDRDDGITPLHIVVARGFTACTNLLLQKGANVNSVSKHRESPLHVACWAGHLSCVKLLLENGAVVNLKDNDYGDSPIHKAAEGGHVLCVKCLLEAGADPNMRNREGNTPLHYAAKSGVVDGFRLLIAAGSDVNTRGADNKKPLNCFKRASKRNEVLLTVDFSFDALTNKNNELWFYLIQLNFEGMSARIVEYSNLYPALVYALDTNGRCALDVAAPANRLAIHSSVLWHGRYRIIDECPEHVSSSCIVYRAVDEALLDPMGQPLRVALKLLKYRYQFGKEIAVRSVGFDGEFVVDVYCSNPAADAILDDYPEVVAVDFDAIACPTSLTCKATKTLAEQVYCMVMPLADRNLFVSIKQDSIGSLANSEDVRSIIMDIAQCVEHVHGCGVLHGDLTPMNIVRVGKKWKLIDFDNASRLGEEAIGDRIPTAYIPPEALALDKTLGTLVIRSLQTAQRNEDIDFLVAHASFDVWALGCVFYQLLSLDAVPLFVTGKDDNLSVSTEVGGDNIWTLLNWNETVKEKKLSRIADPLARNLLSQMLHKDPRLRPSVSRVLAHPYLTLRNVPRLFGEQPAYDIYLSHRGAVGSHDYLLAHALHDELVRTGLRVWWAPTSLVDEYAWRDDFSAGLINAKVYIPLISRDSLSNPVLQHQDVKNLTQGSGCDDLMLEYRLAVELRDLGFIEQIYPVMIGDVCELASKPSQQPQSPFADLGFSKRQTEIQQSMIITYSNYFDSGCFPRAPNVHVDAVEYDLISHFEILGLGTPVCPNRPVSSVLSEIISSDGCFVEGTFEFLCSDPGEFNLGDLQDSPGMVFVVPAICERIAPKIGELVESIYENEMLRAHLNGQLILRGPDQIDTNTDQESLQSTPHPNEPVNMIQMVSAIKAQRDANRQLRHQIVPLVAAQKSALDEMRRVKAEAEQARSQLESQVAELESKLSEVMLANRRSQESPNEHFATDSRYPQFSSPNRATVSAAKDKSSGLNARADDSRHRRASSTAAGSTTSSVSIAAANALGWHNIFGTAGDGQAQRKVGGDSESNFENAGTFLDAGVSCIGSSHSSCGDDSVPDDANDYNDISSSLGYNLMCVGGMPNWHRRHNLSHRGQKPLYGEGYDEGAPAESSTVGMIDGEVPQSNTQDDDKMFGDSTGSTGSPIHAEKGCTNVFSMFEVFFAPLIPK